MISTAGPQIEIAAYCTCLTMQILEEMNQNNHLRRSKRVRRPQSSVGGPAIFVTVLPMIVRIYNETNEYLYHKVGGTCTLPPISPRQKDLEPEATSTVLVERRRGVSLKRLRTGYAVRRTQRCRSRSAGQGPLGALRGRVAMRVGKAQACEQKPRQCFASVNHDPVDKVAIQEGNLLRRLLAAAVDAANLLSSSRHPEEQPLDIMRSGLAEASKDQALVGKGVHVSPR